jgi:predicted nucleotidyltransferase
MAQHVDRDELLDHVGDVLNGVDIEIERAIVFGSVARGTHNETSDIDIILVSQDFEDTPGAKRGKPFRDAWDYTEYGAVDFVPYTPEEYREYRDSDDGLIERAESEGIRIADDVSTEDSTGELESRTEDDRERSDIRQGSLSDDF